jgi:glycosyltransferase involved in cell wall biosynthesis
MRIPTRGDYRPPITDEYVLDRHLLRRYLSSADVYVFPSRNEGFPMAPVEALACGVPVVSADARIQDIFVEGEGIRGGHSSTRRRPRVAAALSRVLHDEALRHKLGRRARRRAETSFDPESVGHQLRDFLDARGAHRR